MTCWITKTNRFLFFFTVEAMGFSGSMEVPGPNIYFVEQPPFHVNVFDGKDHYLTCRLNLGKFSDFSIAVRFFLIFHIFSGNNTHTVWFRDEHKVRAEKDGKLKLSGNRNSAGVYRCLVNQTYLSTSSNVVYPGEYYSYYTGIEILRSPSLCHHIVVIG